ncbi:Kinesin-13A [Ananas comosus]|uniref:Kinesin-like protein n=1 Tax=Ananas comosus TaxID=4615 RepID=A0A199UEB8_ANACO|nr:Kinesin-13A [Ananas comosus]
MNGGATAIGGRQAHRSGHHHQRQFSSDQLLFDSAAGAAAAGGAGAGGAGSKWLHSAAIHHSFSASNLPPPQQQGEYARMARGVQRGMSGELLLSVEPSTPNAGSRSWSQRQSEDESLSPSQLSPGLLDLHSFDTELLPDIPVPGLYDGLQTFGYPRARNFEDLDPSSTANKQIGKPSNVPENNYLKNLAADKERLASVAKIKVVVRKRPLNKKEITKKEEDIITIEQNSNSLTVHETKLKVDLTEYVEKHEFVFDAVLDEDVSNEEVYQETVEPIVPAIFQRTKATCFAYGQTGKCSGKTYTMQPLPLKASHDILRLMHHTYRNLGFQLFVSFFEIYGGKLFDLLNDRRKLCMREDGKQQVCIVGLQEYKVSSVDTIRELIEKGNATRSTGTTGANEESSRSHAILQLAIKRSPDGNESKPPRIVGKLSFIDLAGSERGADTTDNDKQTRIEGAEINKSLLALKECIRALDNDQVHIPFRGSKLTEVLRDSFIGDSRTVMISCISPSSGSCEHTLNTLRYADRVKSLSKSNPKKDLPPASSTLPAVSASEGNNGIASDKNNFGWSKQFVREQSPPIYVDRIPSGREDVQISSMNGDSFKEQRSNKISTAAEIAEVSETAYQQRKPSWRKGKAEAYSASTLEDNKQKLKDVPDADDHLNDLLKEMNLLVEADQPGNQLDDYISRLSAILSQKAAGIVNLQARLAQFQRRLNEHNVLLSSPCP